MDHAILPIRVRPRASRNALGAQRSGRLLVEVTAAPIDGRANAAVCRLLAKRLRVAPSRLSIAGGKNNRDKLVRIEGMTLSEVNSCLSQP